MEENKIREETTNISLVRSSKTDNNQPVTFTGFLTLRATYADTSYWASDTQGRTGSMNFPPMPVGAFEKAVEERLTAILESVRKIRAKTAPTRYRAVIGITATYPDGRQAQRFLEKTVASQISLINLLKSWVASSLRELQEIGGDSR